STALAAAALNCWIISWTSFLFNPMGGCSFSWYAIGEGATVCQPRSSFGRNCFLLIQGRSVLAFLPACANCIPTWLPCPLIKLVICLYLAICSSFQIPRSP